MQTNPAVIGYLHVMKNIMVPFECAAVLSAGRKKLKVTLIVLETAVLNANSITSRILIIENVTCVLNRFTLNTDAHGRVDIETISQC